MSENSAIEDLPKPKWKEEERLRAIDSLCILDTPRESDYDDIAKLAAQLGKFPVAIGTSGLNVNVGLSNHAGTRVKHFLMKPYAAITLLKALRTIMDEG